MPPPIPSQDIQLEITLASGIKVPRALLRDLLNAAQTTELFLPKSRRFPASANLLITDNAAVKRLNRDFRGIDKPTNVLSFPQLTPRQIARLKPDRRIIELGDIAIAYQYVVVEAKKDNKILKNHIVHLVIHGLLHLFGYDHIIDRDALHMERLETRIMAALDLPDPYAASDGKKEPKRAGASVKKR